MRSHAFYLDFEIYPYSCPDGSRFIWQHRSYDGPGDNRSGWSLTLEDAIEAIEAFIDEEEPDMATKSHPLSNHPGALERALRFADKTATQYWEDHQVEQARFWGGIHRNICDLIKNPALWPGEIGAAVRACFGEVRSDEIAKDCAARLCAAEAALVAGDAQ